jgi:uncharacterized membrane-anchored protein YitT (DUF2179 family)
MENRIGIDWIANGLALVATFLMAEKCMVEGWALLFFANCCFIYFGAKTKQWSFFCFNLAFGANSMYGFWRWI